MSEKIRMLCGALQFKSNSARHRKHCIGCITVKSLNEKLQKVDAQILEKNNELEDKNKIIDFLKCSNKDLVSQSIIREEMMNQVEKLKNTNLQLEQKCAGYFKLLKKNPPKRPGISVMKLLLKQNGKCKLCNINLKEDNMDCDHIVRWCDSFDNSEFNLNLLCLTKIFAGRKIFFSGHPVSEKNDECIRD